MPLFDGLHIVVTWLMSYRQIGKSYRMATAETLLGRLAGAGAPLEYLCTLSARDEVDALPSLAVKAHSLIPAEEDKNTIPSRDLEKARDAVKHFVSYSFTAERVFNRIVNGNQAAIRLPPSGDQPVAYFDKTVEPLIILKTLQDEASNLEILLDQLVVEGDSAAKKEQIRRAMAPYKSCVINIEATLETVDASRDIAKARRTLADLLAQWRFRWLCFALGVLPQLLKLFSASGLLAIKICGAGYLFLAGVFECLLFAGKGYGLHVSGDDDAWAPDPAAHNGTMTVCGAAPLLLPDRARCLTNDVSNCRHGRPSSGW